jgi:hypothetical protein
MDEMDLAHQALDVTPWHPDAYARAQAALRVAMTESAPAPEAPQLAGRRNRRRQPLSARTRIGAWTGAGIGIAAVTASVVLAITSTASPSAVTATTGRAPAAASPLVTLAALIKAGNTGQPGNASLVIAKQVNGGKLMQVLYALYTDSGKLYTGDDKKSLMTAVAHHANQADGTNAREIAAANFAAAGDLHAARIRMVNALPNCFGLGLPATARKAFRAKCWAAGAAARREIMREKGIKTPLKQPTGIILREDIDNTLWTAATLALSWGAGNPQIREGVLRLVSTIPEVTVSKGTDNGQPTLVITAGPALFGGGTNQVLTVNAKTGIPLSSVESGPGAPTAVETDQVFRVTLTDITAGKF